MDPVNDVNALLELGVGDPYRLEHIKQAYILNKTIWKSDERYLEQLRKKYLVKYRVEQQDVQPEIDENLESDSENKKTLHCWKCGKKSLFEANFCMVCGSSLYEVGTETKTADVQIPSVHSKNQTKTFGLKIPIMIGIPVLILLILGVGFSQGFFDNVLERQILDDTIKNEINSNCGTGTIFDPETNSCILDDTIENEINSNCGTGTIFDPETNSCILDDTIENKTHSKCGTGTIFDPETNSCILGK